VPQLERPEGDPPEALDAEAYRAAEALDLPVAALGQAELDPVESGPRVAQPPGPVHAGRTVLEDDPTLERRQHVRLETPLHEDVIDASHAVPGMGQAVLRMRLTAAGSTSWTTITGAGRRARNSRMR
jgi:hypothetical protein